MRSETKQVKKKRPQRNRLLRQGCGPILLMSPHRACEVRKNTVAIDYGITGKVHHFALHCNEIYLISGTAEVSSDHLEWRGHHILWN